MWQRDGSGPDRMGVGGGVTGMCLLAHSCWPPGSGCKRRRSCRSWKTGRQYLWRCRGGLLVWPDCSRWSETKPMGQTSCGGEKKPKCLLCVFLSAFSWPWWDFLTPPWLWTQHRAPLPGCNRQSADGWANWQNAGRSSMDLWGEEERAPLKNTEQAQHAMSSEVFHLESPGITRLPPRCQQDEIVVFPYFADRWCGHAIEGVFLIHLHDRLTLPAASRGNNSEGLSLWNSEHEFKPL